MKYTLYELCLFFFFYSFAGWILEVSILALLKGKFFKRGILNGPICPAYGITMVLLLVFLGELRSSYIIQFLACMVIANVIEVLSGRIIERLARHRAWDYSNDHFLLGNIHGFLFALVCGLTAMLTLDFVHPFVYIISRIIPQTVIKIIVLVLLVFFIIDIVATCYVLHIIKRENVLTKDISKDINKAATNLGERIFNRICSRMCKAFPELENTAIETTGFAVSDSRIFAEGLCLDKLFWIFFSCALLGDLIETVYVWLTSGILMSRSSLLYGTFSVVWGFGAVLLTVVLHPLSKREDRYIFIGGFLLGGTYEYMCSVFTELVFGKVFWDYSNMPLNIGGRTNVLFCIFWGILSVVWIKLLYPILSKYIEEIPPVAGKILTWILIVLMTADILISAMAMIRYNLRASGKARENPIGTFLDYQYPDKLIEWTWPNMLDK